MTPQNVQRPSPLNSLYSANSRQRRIAAYRELVATIVSTSSQTLFSGSSNIPTLHSEPTLDLQNSKSTEKSVKLFFFFTNL